MSLKDDLASGLRAQFANKLVRAVAGAILTVGLARLLDPDGYGTLYLALAVLGMVRLVAGIGIGRSAGRYVAEYREHDPAQIPHIVRDSLLLTLGSVLIAVLALLASHRYVAAFLGEPALEPFLVFGAAFVVSGTVITYLKKVLQGFEAIETVAVLGILGRTSRLVLALGLVVVGFGALGALWGYALSALLTSVVAFVYLLVRVREHRGEPAEMEAGLRRRVFEYAVPISITNTSKILDQRIDTLLVGYFLSPVAVSYYVIGEQVVNFLQTPLSALGFTLSPTFGSQKAAGNVDRISRIYEEALTNGLLLYIPAGVGIALVADPTIRLVFGSDSSNELGGWYIDAVRVVGGQ